MLNSQRSLKDEDVLMPEVNFTLSKNNFTRSWLACGFHHFQALHCSLLCMKHAFGKPRKTWFNKHQSRGNEFASLTSFKMSLRHTLFQVTAVFHSGPVTKLLLSICLCYSKGSVTGWTDSRITSLLERHLKGARVMVLKSCCMLLINKLRLDWQSLQKTASLI